MGGPHRRHADVLPAYAGMILDNTDYAAEISGAPRVCGDDPPGRVWSGGRIRCSPRMRG